MGRPIKKSKFVSDFGASTSAKIAVTAYRQFGGAKVDSTTAYIVSQRGSRKFKVHLDDSSEEIMLLKPVAPGSLANDNVNGMGEFMVRVTLDDSTEAYVEKFYNNTVHYVDNAGNTGTVPYSLGQDPTGDFDLESGKGVVDIVSE